MSVSEGDIIRVDIVCDNEYDKGYDKACDKG